MADKGDKAAKERRVIGATIGGAVGGAVGAMLGGHIGCSIGAGVSSSVGHLVEHRLRKVAARRRGLGVGAGTAVLTR